MNAELVRIGIEQTYVSVPSGWERFFYVRYKNVRCRMDVRFNLRQIYIERRINAQTNELDMGRDLFNYLPVATTIAVYSSNPVYFQYVNIPLNRRRSHA